MVPCEEHHAAVGVPNVGQAGLGVEFFPAPESVEVTLKGGVDTGPLERAERPVPGGVFLRAEGEDGGGGLEEEGVKKMKREFVLVVLERFGHGVFP